MDSSWPENVPSHRKMAIGELVRGREIANRLKIVLSRHDQSLSNGNIDLPVDDLVVEILNTFTNSLSMLNKANSDEVCLDSCRKSEDSGESSKSVTTVKDRRGCYKRRKTSHTWTRDSSDLRDDGHAWRKYGQKAILNAKFPRNYFRCTHKYEQKCQATKQVQKIEENPPIFRTTYNGNHTCNHSLKSNSHHHLIITESPDDDDSSNLISFNNNIDNVVNCVQLESDNYDFTSSSSSSIKREDRDINDNIKLQPSSSDYLLSHDNHLSTIDHADVISGANSTFSCTTSNDESFDMDEIMNSVTAHFHDDDALQFAF